MNRLDPRYMYIRRKAYNLLIESGINKLPVVIDEIYIKNGWFLDSLETAENITRKIRPMILASNNCDAVTANYNGHYITLYNENILSLERQLYTKCHECGHIACGHLKESLTTDFCNEDENILKVYEREADIFAAHIIAPLPVLYFAGITKATEIQRICGLSNQASEITAEKIQKFSPKQDDIEKVLLKQFFNFITEQPTNVLGITKGNKKAINLPEGYTDYADWMYVVYNIKKANNEIYMPLTQCCAGYADNTTLVIIPPDAQLYKQINSEPTKDFIRYIIRKCCGVFLDVDIMPIL